MLSSDQTIDKIVRLVNNSRQYGEMRLESFERSFVDKLTAIITGLIIGVIVFIIGTFAIIALSAALVVALAPYVGGYFVAFGLMACCYAFLTVLVYVRRKSLIAFPIKKALTYVMFADKAESPAPTHEEMNNISQAISSDFQSLTAPPSPGKNKFENAMKVASRAWAVADAMVMVYKLYRRFGGNKRRSKR